MVQVFFNVQLFKNGSEYHSGFTLISLIRLQLASSNMGIIYNTTTTSTTSLKLIDICTVNYFF